MECFAWIRAPFLLESLQQFITYLCLSISALKDTKFEIKLFQSAIRDIHSLSPLEWDSRDEVTFPTLTISSSQT